MNISTHDKITSIGFSKHNRNGSGAWSGSFSVLTFNFEGRDNDVRFFLSEDSEDLLALAEALATASKLVKKVAKTKEEYHLIIPAKKTEAK